jgi:hypothetical protein
VGDAGGDVLLFASTNARLFLGHALFPHLRMGGGGSDASPRDQK